MRIDMELGSRSYPILVERGCLNRLGSLANLQRNILVVTDTGVPKPLVEAALAQVPETERREAVEFIWKGKSYSIIHVNGAINIGEGYYVDQNGIARNVESHEPCKEIEGLDAETADGILEYVIDGDKLRDIITQIEVVSRTI